MIQFDFPDFLKSYLHTGLGWMVFISFAGGVYLLISGFVGKFHLVFFSIPIGRQKTKRNKVMVAGAIALVTSLVGLYFNHPNPSVEHNESSIRVDNTFLGKWLLTPSAFNKNQADYTLLLEGTKGKIFREDGGKYGYLSDIKPHPVSSDQIVGKIGMNDGRKLAFKAMLLTGKNMLAIEYSDRATKKVLGRFEAKKIE